MTRSFSRKSESVLACHIIPTVRVLAVILRGLYVLVKKPTWLIFDVGGTLFEVALSTIQKYPDRMLARMVSDEEWKEDGEDAKTPMFIDGNPESFSLILDMMRHEKIDVPMGVSMSMVETDADYYGISLEVANGISMVSNDDLFRRADELRAQIERQENMTKQLKSEVDLIVFVGWCYHKVLASAQSRLRLSRGSWPQDCPLHYSKLENIDKTIIAEYMAAVGLNLSNIPNLIMVTRKAE